MPLAPVRLHDHAHESAPPEGGGRAGAGTHGHAHPSGHDHDQRLDRLPEARSEAAHAGHAHSAHRHHHSHAAGERHPSVRPGFSLLRLSALQRLAIALPLAALLWAMALAVIGAGA